MKVHMARTAYGSLKSISPRAPPSIGPIILPNPIMPSNNPALIPLFDSSPLIIEVRAVVYDIPLPKPRHIIPNMKVQTADPVV